MSRKYNNKFLQGRKLKQKNKKGEIERENEKERKNIIIVSGLQMNGNQKMDMENCQHFLILDAKI